MSRRRRPNRRPPSAPRSFSHAPSVVLTPRKQAPSYPLTLWIILALALAVRLAHLYGSRSSPFYEPLLLDPAYYHQWALKILKGEGSGGVFYGLPLYPYFLAGCYRVLGVSVTAVKVVQAILGVATVFLIFKIGRKIADARVGLWAAGAAAVYGPLFFHESLLVPESLGIPLYAAAFWLACLCWDAPDWGRVIGFGAAVGLAALTKAGILVFAVLFMGAMLWRELTASRKNLLAVLGGVAATLAVLAPVTLHNLRAGDLVPLTSHSGFNFYIGNNPDAEGVFKAPEGTGTNVDSQIRDSRQMAEAALGRALKPSEVSRYWSDRAWAFIRSNPIRFAALSVKKSILFFDAREISDVESYTFASRFNPILRFPWLNFLLIGPLLFAGLYLLWSRHSSYAGLTYTWVFSYISGLLFFFVNARYRLPLLSVMIPVAAVGAIGFYDSARRGDRIKVAVLAGLCFLGLVIGNLRLVGSDRSVEEVNAGDALVEKGDLDQAQQFYREALKTKPDSPKANLAMGVLLTRKGDLAEAMEYYEKSLALDPANAQAHNNLGLWYDRKGDLDEAERHFLKAIELKPGLSQAHNNLGMVYGKKGQDDKAIEQFEQSLKLNPESARAYTNLGLIYYRKGSYDLARQQWERALGVDPRYQEARRALDQLSKRS